MIRLGISGLRSQLASDWAGVLVVTVIITVAGTDTEAGITASIYSPPDVWLQSVIFVATVFEYRRDFFRLHQFGGWS